MVEKLPDPEIDLVGTEPVLLVEQNQMRVVLRMELIQFPPGADLGQPNGQFVHLGMTREDAMRVLEHLKAVQEHYGWQELNPSIALPSKDQQH